jgi:hypothetical protein
VGLDVAAARGFEDALDTVERYTAEMITDVGRKHRAQGRG